MKIDSVKDLFLAYHLRKAIILDLKLKPFEMNYFKPLTKKEEQLWR